MGCPRYRQDEVCLIWRASDTHYLCTTWRMKLSRRSTKTKSCSYQGKLDLGKRHRWQKIVVLTRLRWMQSRSCLFPATSPGCRRTDCAGLVSFDRRTTSKNCLSGMNETTFLIQNRFWCGPDANRQLYWFFQVPQIILDDSHSNNKPCRIFCTQPRRISALTIAERVAAERAEKVGQTVGYQIRLESRCGEKDALMKMQQNFQTSPARMLDSNICLVYFLPGRHRKHSWHFAQMGFCCELWWEVIIHWIL